MQVLRAFEMEEVKIATKQSMFVAMCKDELLAIETLTLEVVCIKKHYRANEMALWRLT